MPKPILYFTSNYFFSEKRKYFLLDDLSQPWHITLSLQVVSQTERPSWQEALARGDTGGWGILALPSVWHWGSSKKQLTTLFPIVARFGTTNFFPTTLGDKGIQLEVYFLFFCAVSIPEHHKPWTTATNCTCPDALPLLHMQMHTNTFFTENILKTIISSSEHSGFFSSYSARRQFDLWQLHGHWSRLIAALGLVGWYQRMWSITFLGL